MKTLADVFKMKDKIIKLVQQFGFDSNDIKIKRGQSMSGEDSKLYLIINKKNDTDSLYHERSWLKAKLVDVLDCQVGIIINQGILALYRYDAEQNSASITNEKTLIELFGTDTFSFADPDNDYLQDILLKQANEYIEKKVTSEVEDSTEKKIENRKYALVGSKKRASSDKDSQPSTKEAKLTFDSSTNQIQLIIPIPEALLPSSLSTEMLSQDIANYLAQQYFDKIVDQQKPPISTTGELEFK